MTQVLDSSIFTTMAWKYSYGHNHWSFDGVVATDVDGDGHVDLIISYHDGHDLLLNTHGNATFKVIRFCARRRRRAFAVKHC